MSIECPECGFELHWATNEIDRLRAELEALNELSWNMAQAGNVIRKIAESQTDGYLICRTCGTICGDDDGEGGQP